MLTVSLFCYIPHDVLDVKCHGGYMFLMVIFVYFTAFMCASTENSGNFDNKIDLQELQSGSFDHRQAHVVQSPKDLPIKKNHSLKEVILKRRNSFNANKT